MSRYLRLRRIAELAALDRPWVGRLLGRGRGGGAAPAATWDSFYREGVYDTLLASGRRHHHRLLAALIAERFPGARVLEIGCGDGAFYESLRLLRPARYLGVDVSPEAIARARARRGGEAEFVVGDGSRFAPSEPFDAVLFTDCIEYLEPPAALMAHYAPHLAPGGVIGATQWLALGPLRLWEEVKACAEVLDEALVQAPFGGAWQVWTARPRA
jgi:SAM-dependent methyltransferase